MDNYYDEASGRWVTAESRYDDITAQPRFQELHLLPAEQAWPRLLELLAVVPEDLVSHVGAGPLENFVNRHGADFVSQIAAQARTDSRFLRAALEVNLARGALPTAAEAELLSAFGPRFTLLPPEPEG
jgi:hypothetical protein